MIDIKDAYNYYVANVDKSCNKSVVDFDTFKKVFPVFIDNFCAQTLYFDLDTKEFIDLQKIPLLTNCGKSVVGTIESIMSEIITWKKQQSS